MVWELYCISKSSFTSSLFCPVANALVFGAHSGFRVRTQPLYFVPFIKKKKMGKKQKKKNTITKKKKKKLTAGQEVWPRSYWNRNFHLVHLLPLICFWRRQCDQDWNFPWSWMKKQREHHAGYAYCVTKISSLDARKRDTKCRPF